MQHLRRGHASLAAAAVDYPMPLDLALHSSLSREPARPPSERGPGFEAEFDATTLFFDAFWMADGQRILLNSPSLLNLKPALVGSRITALPSGRPCRFHIRSFDRHDRITVVAPAGTTDLVIDGVLGQLDVPVGENRSATFAGRRVLLTLSKDNHIDWVLDWVRYHRDRHGADAVLVYDNGSTAYAPEALRAGLVALDGIAISRVVSWPFKYGPQGTLSGGWDSDFCQLGALEHARWRYLTDARSVLNGDIDELVVSDQGESVFAAAEASWSGIVRYDGAWIMGIEGREPIAGPAVRHRDYQTRLRPRLRQRLFSTVDTLGCFGKWTAVPARCPERAQWCPHRIAGWFASVPKTRRFTFRHFRQVNTQWKYDRTALEAFDPVRHMRDDALVRSCAHVRWDV